MSTAELQNTRDVEFCLESYNQFDHETVYRCNFILCPEDVGFSAHCLNLRGVISEGDDEAEAIRNISDAFRETVLYYRESNLAIPFGYVAIEKTPGCREKTVDVSI